MLYKEAEVKPRLLYVLELLSVYLERVYKFDALLFFEPYVRTTTYQKVISL